MLEPLVSSLSFLFSMVQRATNDRSVRVAAVPPRFRDRGKEKTISNRDKWRKNPESTTYWRVGVFRSGHGGLPPYAHPRAVAPSFIDPSLCSCTSHRYSQDIAHKNKQIRTIPGPFFRLDHQLTILDRYSHSHLHRLKSSRKR